MKKYAVIFFTLLISITAFSQNAKYVNALNYLADYNSAGDASSLDKAKENIDICDANPEFKDKAKTQTLKGQIYLAIFQKNLKLETEKQITLTDPKKGEALGYQNTPAKELITSYDAFAKAKTLDTKDNFTSEIKKGITDVSILLSNKAVYDYNAKNYEAALPSFEKTYEINGPKDTITLNNCAVTAEHSGNFEKAKVYYQKMIDAKVGRGSSYLALFTVCLSLKDSVGASKVLKEGRIAFPNDVELLLHETDYYITSNKFQEALTNLNIALAAKPNDAVLYFARGNMYDNLANPKDANGKDLAKLKDYEDKMKLAETDYKKAIELKPDYFEALYNLGVFYNNHGVAINKAADKIADQKLYKIEDEKAKAEFNKAMQVLEKALQSKPKERNTMIALKQIYARLELTDKLNAINEELKK